MVALAELIDLQKEKNAAAKYSHRGLLEQIIDIRPKVSGGYKLVLLHRNELKNYVLVGVKYSLDGATVFNTRVVAGPHQLLIKYELRGRKQGIFSYLEGVQVAVRRALRFDVLPGKVTKITGTAYERSGVTLEFKDRPDIDFDQRSKNEVVERVSVAAKAAETPGGTPPAETPAAPGGTPPAEPAPVMPKEAPAVSPQEAAPAPTTPPAVPGGSP